MSESTTQDIPASFKTLKMFDGQLKLTQERFLASDQPQIVVEPTIVGICRSDIKEFLGTRTVRHDFGHEILGRVISSNDARLHRPGSLVILDPHIRIERNSGFGDLLVATADVESLQKAFVEVPQSIDPERLVFVEPLACARHCVANLLRFEHRVRLDGLAVGIVGAGITGALIALLCKYYGANVTIINRSKERLDFLKSTQLFSKDELCLADEVTQGFDVVIPTTTFLFPEVLRLSEKIVKNRGMILLYGGTKSGDMFPDKNGIDIDEVRRRQIERTIKTTKTIRICGTHGALTKDFETVIDILASDKNFMVEKLISNRITLDEVAANIMTMTHTEKPGKTIVTIRK